ncbi:hypothetical protein D3C74_294370 [compost metagenome]
MASTLGAALKHYLETRGYGIPVFQDGAPVITHTRSNGEKYSKTVDPPYIVIQDEISVVPVPMGDFGDEYADTCSRTLIQVDLFQLARQVTSSTRTVVAESRALTRSLRRDLRGTGIQPWAPVVVQGHKVNSSQRWPISDNIARTTFTVEVAHSDLDLPAPATP